MSTVKKRLRDVANLLEQFKVNNTMITGVSVYKWGSHVQLHPEEFAKLFATQNVPKSKLLLDFDKEGNLHAGFEWRQVKWGCCVLKSEIDRHPSITRQAARLPEPSIRIDGRSELLALPAPVVVS